MRLSQLFSCIFALINFIKRCIFGRKKTKDEDNNVKAPSGVLVQKSAEEEDLQAWDDWGQNDSDLVSIKIESQNEQSEQNTQEVDLFGDMQPVFQKTKQIRLKSQVPVVNNYNQPSDRLKFNSFTSIPETELGTWSEEPDAWDEIPDQETEWETQNVLKEKRMAEREKRALEQQKRKQERDAARSSKKTALNLGVKIS
ncbi:receptor-binding cancer antigen expressed on SiSo cells-like [Dendronephthya gigantea]|uniref:receptor-binding cancer antigen expressed on SiSo cells-like n=1 Tax=Dendronephthya gigantea TaxID=151771 RepID=UPI00106C8447|nr:receptor-binding cancer antigen expressed on SiSo cells-like [Dendronephthya gigantea]